MLTSTTKEKDFDLCWECFKDGDLKKAQSYPASKCFTLKYEKEGNIFGFKLATTSKDNSGKGNRKQGQKVASTANKVKQLKARLAEAE